MKKFLAFIIAVVLSITALPVCANNVIASDFVIDFEQTYTDKEGKTFYYGNKNMSGGGNGRGSHAEIITEANGNKALRLTYDNDRDFENYNANTAAKVFDVLNKGIFKGTAGTTYIISFSYKVEETDNQTLQLAISNCGRTTDFYATDLRLNNTSAMGTQNINVSNATSLLTEKTNGYVKTSAKWTANGTDYPIIALVTNNKEQDATNKGTRPYASVLIDNIEVSEVGANTFNEINLNFEDYYPTTDGQDNQTVSYYSSINQQFFMTANNVRGSHAELITEESGNKAIRLTYDNDSSNWTQYENYNANPAIMIYDPETKTRFKGKAGKTYVISFSYKVEETDDKNLQLYVVNCSKGTNLWGTDLNKNGCSYNAAGSLITEKTDSYITVSAPWTANGTDYPIILLETNNKSTDASHDGTRPYASLLIDNVSVKENVKNYILCHNYGTDDVELLIDLTTTFADLIIPSLSGYKFDGWYVDAALTQKAVDSETVNKYKEIYVKWSGDGTVIAPTEITDCMIIDNIKGFNKCTLESNSEYSFNSLLEQPALGQITKKDINSWYGAYVFENDGKVQNLDINNISLSINQKGSVLFYTELYESCLTLSSVVLNSQSFTPKSDSVRYLSKNSNEWKAAEITENGQLNLPADFKGFICIDFNASTTQTSTLKSIKLNFNGEKGGYTVFGGVLYTTKERSDSTVIQFEGKVFDLGRQDSATVNVYNAYEDGKTANSIRYSGTVGETKVKIAKGDSCGLWNTSAAAITQSAQKTLSTKGYMHTYRMANAKILMQPSVDTFMLYVETGTKNADTPSLKMLSPTVLQGKNSAQINFSNSVYKYLDITNNIWITARAGADGELYDLPDNFKGYIKFDIKQFKGFAETEGIDFTKPYYLNNIEIGINHIGNESAPFVIGALYSVIKDSDSFLLTHGITKECLCAYLLEGDVDLNGALDAADLATLKKAIAKLTTLENAAILRATAISRSDTPNAAGLATLKKYIAKIEDLPKTNAEEYPLVYKNIFSKDVTTSNTASYFPITEVKNSQAIIKADTSLNNNQLATNFANEINSNKIADFEKTGIDKMCHVSTFIYANGNIYTSYYANTVSATENPVYQTARFAYCPENDTDKKVIIDIQTVGDDLYGKKVIGVYDTILMKKENDDTNLYILWTANIAGQYYRLYRIFNMKTETLGEIGVNRFKVGEVTNDFSTSGISSALTANNIGLKTMFSDIGIMQKLSTRIENGETYYYTGAYSGNFTWIIKSKDLITWEYVAQPDIGANGTGFTSKSKWENAVYVLGDKVYYFVRQWGPGNDYNADGSLVTGSPYGILTYYNLTTGEWATPVLVGDCQSRSDFIVYKDELYLFYAPTDRNHIGILKVDTNNLANTSVVLQANMQGSCFYPFVQYNSNGELCMSYTVDRQHIRLASFTLSKYID